MLALRQRPIMRIYPGNNLITEIGVIASGAVLFEELATTERGPAVDPDEDARGSLAFREEFVGHFREIFPEGRTVAPHIKLARQPLNQVNARVAPLLLLIVAGRQIDPQRALIGVAERITLESLALENDLIKTSSEISRPGQHTYISFIIVFHHLHVMTNAP